MLKHSSAFLPLLCPKVLHLRAVGWGEAVIRECHVLGLDTRSNLEPSYIILLAFMTLKAKQAMKKAACTEEPNLVQQLGKMHEVYQLEICNHSLGTLFPYE